MEIRNIYIDLDGVLTDGRVYRDHAGGKMKSFHSRDNWALRELVSLGYVVHIITADSWEGGRKYAEERGCIFIHSRDKTNELHEPFIAIGDDVWDIEMLNRAAIAFCPADASSAVKAISGINVLETKGGYGVISEMLLRLI